MFWVFKNGIDGRLTRIHLPHLPTCLCHFMPLLKNMVMPFLAVFGLSRSFPLHFLAVLPRPPCYRMCLKKQGLCTTDQVSYLAAVNNSCHVGKHTIPTETGRKSIDMYWCIQDLCLYGRLEDGRPNPYVCRSLPSILLGQDVHNDDPPTRAASEAPCCTPRVSALKTTRCSLCSVGRWVSLYRALFISSLIYLFIFFHLWFCICI